MKIASTLIDTRRMQKQEREISDYKPIIWQIGMRRNIRSVIDTCVRTRRSTRRNLNVMYALPVAVMEGRYKLILKKQIA